MKGKSDAGMNLMSLPGTSFSPIGFMELPSFIVLAYVYRADFELRLLWPMFLLYLCKECIGMSVCLHRYAAHSARETRPSPPTGLGTWCRVGRTSGHVCSLGTTAYITVAVRRCSLPYSSMCGHVRVRGRIYGR